MTPYSASLRLAVADRVAHPQFGTGVVQSVDERSAVVLFDTGARTLVHARSANPMLSKPKKIDHGGGGRPPF